MICISYTMVFPYAISPMLSPKKTENRRLGAWPKKVPQRVGAFGQHVMGELFFHGNSMGHYPT